MEHLRQGHPVDREPARPTHGYVAPGSIAAVYTTTAAAADSFAMAAAGAARAGTRSGISPIPACVGGRNSRVEGEGGDQPWMLGLSSMVAGGCTRG
jgi:hypothetical protein